MPFDVSIILILESSILFLPQIITSLSLLTYFNIPLITFPFKDWLSNEPSPVITISFSFTRFLKSANSSSVSIPLLSVPLSIEQIAPPIPPAAPLPL